MTRPPQAETAPGTTGTAIGPRLRAARTARRLTLDEVASACSLSKGFLSRLERDEVSPSVASLVTVCQVLGLRVGDLFEPPVTSVVRAGEGRRINFGGDGVRELLLTPGGQTALQVIEARIEVGGSGGAELYSLACETEFVWVRAGTLAVVLGSHEELLREGDAMTFAGTEPHTWRNAGDDVCEVLWVLVPAP